MNWTTEDPGVGSVFELRGYASARSAAAERLRTDIAANFAAALSHATGWSASTADAVRGVVANLQTELKVIADQLNQEARAIGAYASEVERIQDRVRAIRNRSRELDRRTWGLMSAGEHEERAAVSIALIKEERVELDLRMRALVMDREHADSACVATLAGAGVLGAFASFSTASTDGADLLSKLALLSPTDLLILAHTHPELFEQLRKSPPDPTEVAEWWSELEPAAQAALIAGAPAVIGNLNGVAYGARDKANRIELDRQLDAARSEFERRQKQAWASNTLPPEFIDAETRLLALENIKDALVAETGDRFLIALTEDLPPLAQVTIGNVDTADRVSYLVPGMNTYTSDMSGWSKAAQNLYDEQRYLDGSHSSAVVAWIGYKTPPIPVFGGLDFGVTMGDYARTGGERLAADLAGFNAVAAGRDVSLNVVAHSYGTTTAANTLAGCDYGVDNFVMVGSAGIEPAIDGAAGIHAANIYAAQADNSLPGLSGDPWAWGGRLLSGRDNPVDADFGAIVMGADGEPGSSEVQPTTAHDAVAGSPKDDAFGYLERGSESLWNVAAATTGHPEKITEDQPSSYDPYSPYMPGNPYNTYVPQESVD